MASKPVGGGHRPLTGGVQLEQLERPLGGAVEEARVVHRERSGSDPVHAGRQPRAAHAEPLARVELDEGAQVRGERAHAALELVGAPGVRMRVASEHAGVNSNVLSDETQVDRVSGNAVLNGIPVEISPG